MLIEIVLYLLFAILIFISAIFAWKLSFAFRHFKMEKLLSEPSMLNDLPSVSVCIPARNEAHAMTQCLERVIASKYPKLEIIVLDDSSGDNTSVLIKAFAHAGVRFVEGTPLSEGWLGKNHALQRLLDEASGSLVFFVDVDTQISPDTIGQLVAYLKQERASMISILPRRHDEGRASVFFGTLRYYWELIFHRTSTPAVASSAWMIYSDILRNQLGGFYGCKSDVQPEGKLAATLSASDKYRFIISTSLLGVCYEKKWSSQIDTSIRLSFSPLGNRAIDGLLALLGLLLLNLPSFVLLFAIFGGWSIFQSMALCLICVYSALYGSYLRRVWKKGWLIGSLLWLFVVAQEFVVLIVSFYQYARHSVQWKNRSITTMKKA